MGVLVKLLVGGVVVGGGIYLVSRTTASASASPAPPAGPTPQGGGGGVMSRMEAIQQLQRDLAAERAKTPVDAAKVARLERALGELAAAELQARGVTAPAAPAAAAPVQTSAPPPVAHLAPLYPEGTQASWGGYTGTIKQAWRDDLNRWCYTVVVGPIPVLGTTEIVRDEQGLKDELADRLGQPKGPAYPRGLNVVRNGKGGLVESAVLEGGVWTYRLRGWNEPIGERALADLLGRA